MSDRVDRNKKIFDLRRRNFSRNMVMKLGFLGYLIIIFKYLKYGTNVLSLLFRCVVQALLISPFPDNRIRNGCWPEMACRLHYKGPSQEDLPQLVLVAVTIAIVHRQTLAISL